MDLRGSEGAGASGFGAKVEACGGDSFGGEAMGLRDSEGAGASGFGTKAEVREAGFFGVGAVCPALAAFRPVR